MTTIRRSGFTAGAGLIAAAGLLVAAAPVPSPTPTPTPTPAPVPAPATGAAADRLVATPPPAWVVPHAVPADSADPSTAGARPVLRDNQVSFGADGTVTAYWDDANKVITPDGLAKVASLSLTWNPETDSLAVHRVRILRDGAAIDVLQTQHFTVLRRETNLERATIDGRLTASLQIAGLRVGDVVEIAASRRSRDPALGGHHEIVFGFPPTTIDTRLAAHWPRALPIRWRAMPGLPAPVETSAGAARGVSMTVANLREPVLPRGAPPRFRQANTMQFSDWKDWAQIAALMAPLYARAATPAPDGAVAAEAAKIAAASTDPVARAEAALALVQDQVRYLFIGLDDGGYVPAPADQTWQRRYGDCKGKTALLLALLHALGIEAQPVVVNATGFGDAIPRYLPAVGLFNHVLVRATIAGRVYWLDGTRTGDRHLADIRTPAFRWGLPIQPAGATLVPMMPDPPAQPLTVTRYAVDASAGFERPVPVHAEYRVRGDGAIGFHRGLDALTDEGRTRELKALWRKAALPIDPVTVSARFDTATGEETLSADGTATLDWQDGALELSTVQIGAAVDFTREPGPDADAPFAVGFPFYAAVHETIVLPDHGRGFTLDPLDVDTVIAGIALHRAGRIADGIATLDLSRRAVAPEFPAVDAPAAQLELRRLLHRHVSLRRAAPAGAAPAGVAPAGAS